MSGEFWKSLLRQLKFIKAWILVLGKLSYNMEGEVNIIVIQLNKMGF